MKRRVADHKSHVAGVLRHQILDNGVERPAGFAGWVKKLDDGDGCTLRAKDRRMHTNQSGLLRLNLHVLRCLHTRLIGVHAQEEEHCDDGDQAHDSHFFGVHKRIFLK